MHHNKHQRLTRPAANSTSPAKKTFQTSKSNPEFEEARNTLEYKYNVTNNCWNIYEIENDLMVASVPTMSDAKKEIARLKGRAFQGFTPRFMFLSTGRPSEQKQP